VRRTPRGLASITFALLSLSALAAHRNATPTPLPSPAGPPLPVGAVDVPAAACSATTDSAAALESFLAQVQNGSTVTLPADARCMVSLTVNLGYPPPGQTTRNNVVYDLNGATIFRTTEPACTPNRDCNGPVVALDGVDHVTLENGTIGGGGPATDLPTYNPANEHDSGLRLHGDSEITVTGMTIQNIAGDCIDLDVNAFFHNRPDTNIWIGSKPDQPFVCSGAGRQGISANAVDGLTIQGATVDRIAHSAIDLEPRKNGYLRNITVSGNRLGAAGVSEIAAHGASTVTSDVAITDNVQTGASPLFISAGNKSQRGPMTVTGNHLLSPAYVVHFAGSASGNTLTGPTGGCMFQIDGSGRFTASGNTFPTGVRESCVVAAGTALHASSNGMVVRIISIGGLVAATALAVWFVRRRRHARAPDTQ
jgi:hypothetical protein